MIRDPERKQDKKVKGNNRPKIIKTLFTAIIWGDEE
jgi:hypothetical protein